MLVAQCPRHPEAAPRRPRVVIEVKNVLRIGIIDFFWCLNLSADSCMCKNTCRWQFASNGDHSGRSDRWACKGILVIREREANFECWPWALHEYTKMVIRSRQNGLLPQTTSSVIFLGLHYILKPNLVVLATWIKQMILSTRKTPFVE